MAGRDGSVSLIHGETPAGGCGAVDLGFNDFAVTGGVTSSNISLTAGGGAITTGPPDTITPIGLTLTSSDWTWTTGGDSLTSNIQFLGQVAGPPNGTGTPAAGFLLHCCFPHRESRSRPPATRSKSRRNFASE
jgi:hypothetical protein